MDYFVDSNIFLRTLVKEDKRSFEESLHFLKLVDRKQISAITSPLILAEIDWILEGFYKFKKSEVIKALGAILRIRGLKMVDNSNPTLAIELYKRYSIKFIDALIASNPQIQKKEMTIVSYDRDFDKLHIGARYRSPTIPA